MIRQSYLVTVFAFIFIQACGQTKAQVFNPANGHYYERVDSAGTWYAAEAAAAARTLGGVSGHLVTLTSLQENDFVFGNLPIGSAWLGGFQQPGSAEPAGGWQWVTGELWDFTNWQTAEPNNASNDDGLQFSGGTSLWNDIPRHASQSGYIVEYPIGAELFQWTSALGGSFQQASHWSANYVPSTTEPAIFDLSSSGYTVTATADITTGSLAVRNDVVTLELASNTWTLPAGNALTLEIAEGSGEAASLELGSGTLVAGRTAIASPGSTGTLIVDGPTAEISVLDSAVLLQGNSSLSVRNGGRLTVAGEDPDAETTLYVATHAGSVASVVVTGPDSHLETDEIYIGERGTGKLDVLAGGKVSVTEFTFRVGGTSIATNPLADGVVTVNGAGSQITSHQQAQIGDSNATGTLVLEEGGSLQSGIGSSATGTSGIIAWRGSGSKGLVTITGTGSEWTQDGNLVVGWEGAGELRVENGGFVHSLRGQLGRLDSGSGTVEVAVNSAWFVDEDLSIGGTEAAQGGQGLLEINSGGRVYAETLRVWESGVVEVSDHGTIILGFSSVFPSPGTIKVGGNATLRGNGTIKGFVHAEGHKIGTESLRATIAPGNGGTATGRLTIDGDYLHKTVSNVEIDLAGPQAGAQYDQLFITGQATFNGGGLRVSLAGGYTPLVGDSFKIFDWSSQSGAFTSHEVNLPALPSGISWNTRKLYTNGLLSVTPTPAIIARWTFEAGNPGNPVSASGTTLSGVSPATGSGIASGFHTSAATVWDNPAGNGSAESMSSNNWAVGDYYQFQISTAGLQDVQLAFEQIGSSSGPRDFQLQYSTDGTLFTDFGAPYMVRTNANPPWTVSTPTGIDSFSFDLSSLTGINDQSSLFLRLTVDSNVSTSGGVISTGGTSRLDNVTISGTQLYGLAGDYDLDDDVDGADFLAWQRQLGASVPASTGADGNGDGVVDAADLTVWRDRFGNTAGSSSSATSAVPEPSSAALCVCLVAVLACKPVWQRRPS